MIFLFANFGKHGQETMFPGLPTLENNGSCLAHLRET